MRQHRGSESAVSVTGSGNGIVVIYLCNFLYNYIPTCVTLTTVCEIPTRGVLYTDIVLKLCELDPSDLSDLEQQSNNQTRPTARDSSFLGILLSEDGHFSTTWLQLKPVAASIIRFRDSSQPFKIKKKQRSLQPGKYLRPVQSSTQHG